MLSQQEYDIMKKISDGIAADLDGHVIDRLCKRGFLKLNVPFIGVIGSLQGDSPLRSAESDDGNPEDKCSYSLTPQGYEEMSSFESMAHNKSSEKTKKIKSSIFNMVWAIVIVIIGVVVERYFDVLVAFFKGILHL